MIVLLPSQLGLKNTLLSCKTPPTSDVDMTLNNLMEDSCNAEVLGNVEYFFIAIVPMSALAPKL